MVSLPQSFCGEWGLHKAHEGYQINEEDTQMNLGTSDILYERQCTRLMIDST